VRRGERHERGEAESKFRTPPLCRAWPDACKPAKATSELSASTYADIRPWGERRGGTRAVTVRGDHPPWRAAWAPSESPALLEQAAEAKAAPDGRFTQAGGSEKSSAGAGAFVSL
jgi:hypothetical protein